MRRIRQLRKPGYVGYAGYVTFENTRYVGYLTFEIPAHAVYAGYAGYPDTSDMSGTRLFHIPGYVGYAGEAHCENSRVCHDHQYPDIWGMSGMHGYCTHQIPVASIYPTLTTFVTSVEMLAKNGYFWRIFEVSFWTTLGADPPEEASIEASRQGQDQTLVVFPGQTLWTETNAAFAPFWVVLE